jgi:hypothetical protein
VAVAAFPIRALLERFSCGRSPKSCPAPCPLRTAPRAVAPANATLR